MASHFSSLGFKVTNQEDFTNYLKQAYENGENIKTDLGTYIKWEVGNGIELWGQLDVDNNAIGLNPHFTGNSSIKIRIQNKIKRDNDTILEGAFYCWADPDETGEDGAYPFIVDLPNIEIYNLNIPQVVIAQITGFAHELSAYRNDDEFDNAQTSMPKFATESFIPAGLFDPNGNNSTPQQSMAIFTGHVIDTSKIINPITGQEFIWIKVSTLGGEYDIVADPQLIEDEISIGGVVSGMFWLSGKVIGDYLEKRTRKEKFSLRKLFRINK